MNAALGSAAGAETPHASAGFIMNARCAPESRGMSMDVTTGSADIAATRGEPAAPGTYGESPRGHRLPDALRLGPVRLAISDLDRSLEFYQDVLGMRVTRRDEASATLAAGGDDRP